MTLDGIGLLINQQIAVMGDLKTAVWACGCVLAVSVLLSIVRWSK